MKETTKKLRREMESDLLRLRYIDRSADEKRTAKQISQSYDDRIRHMMYKWRSVEPETRTQARYVSIIFAACERLAQHRDYVLEKKGEIK